MLVIVSLISVLSFLSREPGWVTRAWLRLLTQGFGWGAYVVPIAIGAVGIWLLWRHFGDELPPVDPLRIGGVALLFVALLAFIQAILIGVVRPTGAVWIDPALADPNIPGFVEGQVWAEARACPVQVEPLMLQGWVLQYNIPLRTYDIAQCGHGGGYIGAFVQDTLRSLIGNVGVIVITLTAMVGGYLMATRRTLKDALDFSAEGVRVARDKAVELEVPARLGRMARLGRAPAEAEEEDEESLEKVAARGSVPGTAKEEKAEAAQPPAGLPGRPSIVTGRGPGGAEPAKQPEPGSTPEPTRAPAAAAAAAAAGAAALSGAPRPAPSPAADSPAASPPQPSGPARPSPAPSGATPRPGALPGGSAPRPGAPVLASPGAGQPASPAPRPPAPGPAASPKPADEEQPSASGAADRPASPSPRPGAPAGDRPVGRPASPARPAASAASAGPAASPRPAPSVPPRPGPGTASSPPPAGSASPRPQAAPPRPAPSAGGQPRPPGATTPDKPDQPDSARAPEAKPAAEAKVSPPRPATLPGFAGAPAPPKPDSSEEKPAPERASGAPRPSAARPPSPARPGSARPASPSGPASPPSARPGVPRPGVIPSSGPPRPPARPPFGATRPAPKPTSSPARTPGAADPDDLIFDDLAGTDDLNDAIDLDDEAEAASSATKPDNPAPAPAARPAPASAPSPARPPAATPPKDAPAKPANRAEADAPARPAPAAPPRVGKSSSKKKPEWKLPEVETMLSETSKKGVSDEELRARAMVIEQTLSSFGAPGRVVEVNFGPVITQYGVEPDYIDGRAGKRIKVKVGKISSLADDLALALAAPTIRIEAPVPGKGYVGIEVPNAESSVVSLREVIDTPEFRNLKSPLKLALGQDVSGQPVIGDLTSMPHLLIAGTTGSGKSVCVNGIICTMLMTCSPDELKMIMVDPKRVELTNYNGIPHLMSPVVTELERIVGVLKWVQREMDERYRSFAMAGARNIMDYNSRVEKGKADGERLPYILVIVDELADLMMLAPDETERVLTRLAQMARATGIHIIISTQRPSVDVVTGLIKANFPARIAFAVATGVDSRVVLDMPGAEKLLGRGDMLFQPPDAPMPVRMQGVYVSDEEIQSITDFWRKQADAMPKPAGAAQGRSGSSTTSGGPQKSIFAPADDEDEGDEGDDLFGEAVELVRDMEKASISLLQRHLRIGYTRAARLIDLMEERGVIGPHEGGSKPRDVLGPDGEPLNGDDE